MVESSKSSFKGGAKSLYSLLNITTHTYNHWKSVAHFHCSKSPLGICVKRVPGQITSIELNTMKSMLSRKQFEHWPICSVWGYALRKGLVSLSLSSWYKYNQRFNFRIKDKKGEFKKVYHPITAPRANHTWHADITIVKTLDGVKHYVYLITDNFSKHILNWQVHDSISGKLRTGTIRAAIEQEFGEQICEADPIKLIVDGGPENNNKTVEQYIKNCEVDITKLIALKDIVQSNSMIEAKNKILKHRYLFRKELYNHEHLMLHLKEAVHDYCYQRPHYALGISTPYEAHTDTRPQLKPNLIKNAIKERIEKNKSNACSLPCS